jgi:hypothetical protein
VLVAGAEDPRLALYEGAMVVTFNHLLRTAPDDDCPAGDVVRRVYIAPLSAPPAGALRPALLAPPAAVALSSQEKNWLVFAAADGLHAVYSIEPHVVIDITPTGAPAASAGHFTTSSGALAALAAQQRAALHGGANAVAAPPALLAALALPAGSRMLGAFHSLDARSGSYANYAYLFNAAPPFAVTHVSSPLPLTEAPPQPGAETPRGAHMAFLSGVVAPRTAPACNLRTARPTSSRACSRCPPRRWRRACAPPHELRSFMFRSFRQLRIITELCESLELRALETLANRWA